MPAQLPVSPADGVQLNLPKNSELSLLVDYVSQRLGVQILYDEAVANKRLTVKAPEAIPVETLLQVLESALKMKGLALVDADVPGWKRIEKSDDLLKIAKPGQEAVLAEAAGTDAITQAFTLRHVTPERLAEVIKPFLTEPGANTLALAEQRVLIVTDYASNLRKIARLVETIDQAGPEAEVRFYEAKHVEAAALQKQIGEVLAARVSTAAGTKLQITAEPRTNKLILIGPADQVAEAIRLAESVDVPLGLRTEVYELLYVEAGRIDSLVQDLFDELTIKRLYQSAIDEEDNLLIVTATDAIHERIDWLREQLDVEAKRPGSAVQFYRLKFADALEVLQTIQSIQQNGPAFDRFATRGVSPLGRGRFNNNQYATPFGPGGGFVPGPNRFVPPGTIQPVTPPAVIPQADPTTQAQPLVAAPAAAAPQQEDGLSGLLSGNARVTADPTSNAIIVVADRATQEVYKNLIEFLDQRRPQVMIEAKVVVIDTTNGTSVGVEISLGDRSGAERLFEFTSYGLSTVDPITGALSLIPGRGFNWALVEPDTADAVVRALSTHTRSKVVSAPRLLVDDNATGTLASVSEVPFTSINASDTVATTSFAGFAEAGTTLEVTPRISDEDHLQLEYVVTLNSFTGTGGDGVPPPRQTNEIASSVTIPDGYTVIVGGLNFHSDGWEYDGIPFIERIPVLKELTGIEATSNNNTTLFFFLRPVILRDDKFADLKYLSDRDLKPACIGTNYPVSRPQIIR
ncbi:MAG: secretin N-terminal domain-containing protein [Planctomycetota bacterium]